MLYNSNDFTDYLDNFNLFFSTDKDSNNFCDIETALERGNLFRNLYLPYKNYSVKQIKVDNERDKVLLEIYQLDFAVNDLNLYLDIYPNDKKALSMLIDYKLKLDKLIKYYGEKYQPLCLEDVKDNKYNWLDNPWPWDKMEGFKYV